MRYFLTDSEEKNGEKKKIKKSVPKATSTNIKTSATCDNLPQILQERKQLMIRASELKTKAVEPESKEMKNFMELCGKL